MRENSETRRKETINKSLARKTDRQLNKKSQGHQNELHKTQESHKLGARSPRSASGHCTKLQWIVVQASDTPAIRTVGTTPHATQPSPPQPLPTLHHGRRCHRYSPHVVTTTAIATSTDTSATLDTSLSTQHTLPPPPAPQPPAPLRQLPQHTHRK